MHTHLEQWAANTAAPGEQLEVRCLAQGSHLSRGQFDLNFQFQFEPTTSGYKSNALSTRPPLPRGPNLGTLGNRTPITSMGGFCSTTEQPSLRLCVFYELLFSLYMLPLSQIMRKNQIAYHSYADDTQIYLALSPNDYSPIDSLYQCIDEINSWMCQNFLHLNKEKTEVIAFGNKDEVLKVNAYLDSKGQTTKNQVRNLGVILETDLSFSSHVKAVTKSAYYHLKNIARIRCFVSSQDLEKLVHAFITSRVDYCNGLLTGLPKKTIRQLQLIQNAAARILTRTRKYEHITPVLRSLHWLPVTFRIDFNVLLLVYKSLNGIGPKYMADMLTEYKPNRALRSLGSSQLEIPRVHTKQGESAFSYYAARSWSQLPEEIKCAKTLATFKSRLKTHLFSCAFVE